MFTRNKLPSSKQICFVRDHGATRPEKMFLSHIIGWLDKCMEDGAAAKLQECLIVGQDTEDSRFKLANDRLRVLMADAHHVFAADILYHKKCYCSYLNQIRKYGIVKKKLRS